jgi:predicted nucleic acid-binding protein
VTDTVAIDEFAAGLLPYYSVAELSWRLDRRGIVLPMSDLVIASCAFQANIPVLTLDHDFRRIPRLKTRRTLS